MGGRDWMLAASTLGAVEEDLGDVVAILQRHDARAVELRSAEGAFIHTALGGAERATVRDSFASAGIDVFAVASRVRIASADDDDQVVTALADEMRLAADLGARFVRVFPGAPATRASSDEVPELEESVALVDTRAVSRLVRVVALSRELGVAPVLETHDSHPRGEDIARILEGLDQAAPAHPVGAIWDVLHPWRVGEELSTTAAALARYIVDGRGYVQIKDVARPGDTTPVLQGQGTVPLEEFLGLLADVGYDGPVSLEWERFWNPDVPRLDAALEAAARALRPSSR